MHPQLHEFKETLALFKRQFRSRRPLAERSYVLNWSEVAAVLGLSRMSVWRYRKMLSIPKPPVFKSTIKEWAHANSLPRKRGPAQNVDCGPTPFSNP
jgi:predicted DNA-binding transcriptional regulator AlpA